MAAGLAAVTSLNGLAQQARPVARTAGSVPADQRVSTRWQPVRPAQAVRPVQATDSEDLPLPPAEAPRSSRSGASGADRRVPMTDRSADGYSVMQPRLIGPDEDFHDPLDGQIIYEGGGFEGFDEGYLPGSEYVTGPGCGCEGVSCDGGCDSFGGSCITGGCDPRGGTAWRPCLTLCLPEAGWVSFEYLGWWQSGMQLPQLATTGPASSPGRDTLFGGEEVLDDGFSGGRLQFGVWLDRCHTWSAAAEYFELSSRTAGFSARPGDHALLARPFLNASLNLMPDYQFVDRQDGTVRGSLDIRATSELVGGGFHFRRQTNSNTGCSHGLLCNRCGVFHSRTDGLFGYRYVQLDELVGINENLTSAPAMSISDEFRTSNQFNGFDMGINYRRWRGPWSVDLLAKLAIGNTRQRVDIAGSTQSTNGLQQGGILAQTSNIGSYSRDRFTIMPELGATLGYQWTPSLRLKLGYTMIFWSNVVRPGDQIDMIVNPQLFPTGNPGALPQRPQFDFRDSDYWVQGISFGGEFTW